MATAYDVSAAGAIWGGDASESAEPAGGLALPEGCGRARTSDRWRIGAIARHLIDERAILAASVGRWRKR
jgi:hypothetical protein